MSGKRKSFKVLILSLIAALLIFIPAMAAPQTAEAATPASKIEKVEITPYYHQDKARDMLTLLNKWRAGNTWYYNSSNTKVYLKSLKPLTYDYTLEKYAMQRAAEIAIHFDHTRPRGDSRSGISGYTAFGENIAATTNSEGGQAYYALDMYKEEDKPYSNQGHRRLMLSVPGDFSNIGIACISYRGAYYWCQVYGMGSNSDTKKTPAHVGNKTMTVEVNTGLLTSKVSDFSNFDKWKAEIKKGKTDHLPEIDLSISTVETWPHQATIVQAKPVWTSSNPNVVKVDSNNGTITGLRAGTATVTVKEPITGKSKSKKVQVLFEDVPVGAKNFEQIYWASSNGVTNGNSENKFCPDRKATREEAVTFIYNYAGKPKVGAKTAIKDISSCSSWGINAVKFAKEKNLTTRSDNKFLPKNSCTRAEMVTFLWRLAGKPAPATKKNPFSDVKESAYYYKAVLWAKEKKVTSATTKFNPGGKVSRRDAIIFIYNYNKTVGKKYAF